MTRDDVLEMLNVFGEDSESDFNEGLRENGGWFGWSVTSSRGETTLTVRFEDGETNEVFKFEWILDPKES